MEEELESEAPATPATTASTTADVAGSDPELDLLLEQLKD
jgi:hypothetical protein